MAAYEATSMRELPPLEGQPGQQRRVLGAIAYDGPQQGFSSIDVIPRILFNQATEGLTTDMTVDQDSGPSKRGAEGDVRTNTSPPSGGDGGWNIFRNTTPYLIHDGARVSPARYYLHMDYPEAPTGASNILDIILRGCDNAPPKEDIDGNVAEGSPSKKPREAEQLSVTAATTTATNHGGFAIVQPASSSVADADI